MRIVQVANFYGPRSGGIRTTMHHLGRGYLDLGHDSVLIVPGARDGEETTSYGRVITMAAPSIPGTGGYRVITEVDRVCTVLEEVAPDRIEVSDRASLRAIGWWSRACGIPSVMWAHERLDGVLRTYLPGPWPARSMADRWNAATAARFDKVVCSTSYARVEFDRIGWTDVEQVPLGVDLDQFTPSRRDEDLRATLLAGDDLLLVLCSRLSKEKVPERAVAVLEQLVSRGIRARLVVAGSGPMAARLAANVVARDLPVTFLGHLTERADLAGLLASADLVLAPGPIETFGLAALEALAGGTPVVASRSGALRDVIDGDAGRLATDSDAAFIDAVDDLLSVPETRRRAAARSRAERFPWSETIDAMVRVHALASVRSASAGIRV